MRWGVRLEGEGRDREEVARYGQDNLNIWHLSDNQDTWYQLKTSSMIHLVGVVLMGHALIEYGTSRIRVNTQTLEATIGVLAQAAQSSRVEYGPPLSNWLSFWRTEVNLYGVGHFNLGLDRLLESEAVRGEFLILLDEGVAWATAQGEFVPGYLLHEMVGGRHWIRPEATGWESARISKLISDLRELVLTGTPVPTPVPG